MHLENRSEKRETGTSCMGSGGGNAPKMKKQI